MTSTTGLRLVGLLVILLVTAGIAWLITWCRFDQVGFAFFMVGCGVAASAFWLKLPWWSRPLPLLVMLGSLGVCEQHAGEVTRQGRVLGDALVAQCRTEGRCPTAPQGFLDGRAAIIDERGSARYVVDGDGLGFHLRVRNAIGTSSFHGGVTTGLTVDPPAHLPD